MIVLVDVLIATWKRPDDEEARESTLQRTTSAHFSKGKKKELQGFISIICPVKPPYAVFIRVFQQY